MQTLRRAGGLLRSERDFRYVLGSQFLGQAADGIAQAAFYGVLVLNPLGAGTPERILGLFALTLLPYSLVSPFLGVFVDRWSRRALMTHTNLARALLLVTLPLWSRLFSGDTELYIGSLGLLGLGRLFLSTKGAVLPVVVHDHQLLKANAISGGGGMLCALGGGVLGLLGIAQFSADTVFALSGIVYAAAGFVVRGVSDPLAHPHEHGRSLVDAAGTVAHDLADGVKEIWRRANARLPLMSIFVLRTIVMFIAVAAILLIKREYPGDVGRLGRLSVSGAALGAAGVGAFAAALTAPLFGRRLNKPGLILLGFVVSGIGIAALGGVQHLAAILVLTLIGGYGSFMSKVATDAQVQEALPDEYRGRAFALYDILYNVASVVAGTIMVLFAQGNLRVVLILTGVATLVFAALFGVAMKRAGLLDVTASAPAS